MAKIESLNADKYDLYVRTFQSPDADLSFVERVFTKLNSTSPIALREDFCGTGVVAANWVKRSGSNSAIGIDIDSEPLRWFNENVVPKLSPDEQKRIEVVNDDLRTFKSEMVDCILALNHSFMTFKSRDVLKGYLESCRKSLSNGRVFIADIYAGSEARCPGMDFLQTDPSCKTIWCQSKFNPLTNEALNRVHFVFSDGSKLLDAFVYDWRLWSVAEMVELLLEVGFSSVSVFDKMAEKSNACEPNQISNHASYDNFEVYVVGQA